MHMFEKMIKNNSYKGTLRNNLKGTNKGVFNHRFHAGIASK